MNRSSKIKTLGFLLLTITIYTVPCDTPNNSPSYYQMVITWIFGYPEQPQSDPEQAPADVTAQDYINQFRSDLNGSGHHHRTPIIPWDEVNEMEAIIKQELRLINLRNKDKANQKIRTVLLHQVRTQTISDLKQLEQAGLYVTSEDYESIPNSHEYDILSRLNRMPHLNGESIAQYFGESRKRHTRDALFHRHQNNPFYPSRDVYR